MKDKSKIYIFEPIFFIFFGLFYTCKILYLFDKESPYAFLILLFEKQGVFYYLIMFVLATLCLSDIIIFIKNIGKNYFWRFAYFFMVLYTLFLILDANILKSMILYVENAKNLFAAFGFMLLILFWVFYAFIGIISLVFGFYIFDRYNKKIKESKEN